VTLVMVGTERDSVDAALDAVLNPFRGIGTMASKEDVEVLERHLNRLRQARTGSWGKRR
jgi:hypothetical protein